MAILSHLRPERAFYYFEKLCGIPHGSGNIDMISDYLTAFAKAHDLSYIKDHMKNVIIFKEGTEGYEAAAPVILQGHMDMVCEKETDCGIDFETEGLELVLSDGWISARGTSLGGDDGVAIAYMLAILEAEDIPHPPLECIFTVDEEIGLLGAAGLDVGCLRSKRMLNIDSEEKDYILTSCAGGATVNLYIPVERKERVKGEGRAWHLSVTGLLGGHSGMEIDKGRANANIILGRLLDYLINDFTLDLISLSGGSKDNVIARSAEAVVFCPADGKASGEEMFGRELAERIRLFEEIVSGEYSATDPGIRVSCCPLNKEEPLPAPLGAESTLRCIRILRCLPNGPIRMSPYMEGLVQTSLNLGILGLTDSGMEITFSVRSGLDSEKHDLIRRLCIQAEVFGGCWHVTGDYPAWEYKERSMLRDLAGEAYQEAYGREPVFKTIHAGLECGIFAGKIPDLDCISFGPEVRDIHSAAERLEVDSFARTWDFILAMLKGMK